MEIQNLTDEQINSLVMAELGYVWFDPRGILPYWQFPSDRTKDLVAYLAPKFSASLDACATFEATITDRDLQACYAMHLVAFVHDELRGSYDFECVTATPRQRCIAFLRMKGVL